MPGLSLNSLQLCFWYCLEVERRKDIYSKTCREKNIPVVEISLEELKDFSRFEQFCADLGLELPADARDQHAGITARKVNRKGKYLPKMSLTPPAVQERKVWDALGAEGEALYERLATRYDWGEGAAA